MMSSISTMSILSARPHALRQPNIDEYQFGASARSLSRLKLARRYPRDFTFYVADPISSVRSERCLRLFAGTHDRKLAARSRLSRIQNQEPRSLIYRKPLTIDEAPPGFPQVSFNNLRLRGGHGLPRSPISVPGLPPKHVPVQP